MFSASTRYVLNNEKSRCPVLLSNGDMEEAGAVPPPTIIDAQSGVSIPDPNASDAPARHWALFRDPFPKPSYLFALVAGNIKHVEEKYVVGTGAVASASASDNSQANADVEWEYTYGYDKTIPLLRKPSVNRLEKLKQKVVSLKVFAEPASVSENRNSNNKVSHAMTSLVKSMKFDEEYFGLEYDLNTFNVV